MIRRNREVARACAAFFVIGAFGAFATWRIAGPVAAACTAVVAALLLVAFLVATALRYRALARLAAQVDAVLHGERNVSFERMREGELAILASELDKMRTRLTLAAEDLSRERNALADSLADISHQLKTPLTSLALMTSLVRGALVEDGSHEQELARLRTMERLEDRVEWLVSSLLKLARIDAGVVRLSREHVSASELVARAADPLAIAFDLADVRLVCDVQPGAGFCGDLAWTAEALENILKNCLEHTPAGGEVRVSVTQGALAFRVRVTDTGPGIAEDDLPHVFERFWRSGERDAPSEVEPSGVGIGLALAKSLVTAQGGQIRAGNAPNGGAAFDIAFFSVVV